MKLFLVDPWGDYDQSFMETGGFHADLSDDEHDLYLEKTKQQTEFAEERRTIIRKRSIDAANDVKEPLDFVFIDGDHSYEGCKIDIESWVDKVKPGGWLMGHDYDNQSVPEGKLWGVDKAVQEFALKHGYDVELGEDYTWFIRIPQVA
jgi:predicted O-methyltransferase YrrM